MLGHLYRKEPGDFFPLRYTILCVCQKFMQFVAYFKRPPRTYSPDSSGDKLDEECQVTGTRNSQTVVEAPFIVTH